MTTVNTMNTMNTMATVTVLHRGIYLETFKIYCMRSKYVLQMNTGYSYHRMLSVLKVIPALFLTEKSSILFEYL